MFVAPSLQFLKWAHLSLNSKWLPRISKIDKVTPSQNWWGDFVYVENDTLLPAGTVNDDVNGQNT